MNINVKHEGYALYLTDDIEWRCWHVIDASNVEVEPPCCSAFIRIIECGCGGMYSVYCPDCQNDDMSENDITNILEGIYDNDQRRIARGTR